MVTTILHFGLAVLGVGLLWTVPTTARAASIAVTSAADSGSGALRSALASATNGDTIDARGISGTILLSNAELEVTNSVTVGSTVTHTSAVNQVTISLPSRYLSAFNFTGCFYLEGTPKRQTPLLFH